MPEDFCVIDLFAGPGGLGEGFSAFEGPRRQKPFKIHMSVEMEPNAHRTLELRAFVRQFKTPPEAYYKYLRSDEDMSREVLFAKYPKKARAARQETLNGPKELGPDADDEEIYTRLDELISEPGAPWVVIGGPPCQAYSLVGRARNKGVQGYKPEADRRHFLYEEYLKVLSKVRPKVFVMENVKGILSSKVNGTPIFSKLLVDLECPDAALGEQIGKNGQYKIYSLVSGEAFSPISDAMPEFTIKSEDYGVPQARHRVILLGVREDVAREPTTLVRHEAETTVRQIIGNLPKLRSKLSRGLDSLDAWHKEIQKSAKQVASEFKKQGLDGDKVLAAGKSAKNRKNPGGQFVRSDSSYRGPAYLKDWIPDQRLGGFTNHETRGHMPSDLTRYLYYSCYAVQRNGLSPHVHDLPEPFLPEHKNVTKDDDKKRVFADRFKVQAANKPASTITSHIKKDGHYFIHYDPSQCRSLTAREAARLQTFPDNYFFEGSQGAQLQQVGNAVPPWLATQIAKVVYELLK